VAVVGIVPAGGSGQRLGAAGPKAFVSLSGRPLVEWSVDALEPFCERIVVAVPPGYEQPPDRVRGAGSRSGSVRNALDAAPAATVVVVHDAARPMVDGALVESCLRALRGDATLAGVIAAAPVTDTVKQAGPDGRVTRTLDRTMLWAVQTPQVFRADALRGALAVDDAMLAAATDDAGLVEEAGGTVAIVPASRDNLKVTTALDLRVAEALLANRVSQSGPAARPA